MFLYIYRNVMCPLNERRKKDNRKGKIRPNCKWLDGIKMKIGFLFTAIERRARDRKDRGESQSTKNIVKIIIVYRPMMRLDSY